jgi:hypothetical protein
MTTYWKNSKFTKRVRITKEKHFWLLENKGNKSIASKLDDIISEHQLNSTLRTLAGKSSSKIDISKAYGLKELQIKNPDQEI